MTITLTTFDIQNKHDASYIQHNLDGPHTEISKILLMTVDQQHRHSKKRKDLAKTFMVTSIWKKTLVSMACTNIFQGFKEWFNCKTRMPRTVKCRPTVAYWVQIDGINIATELITRYYLNGTLIQCCFNARPTSATLAQHWTNIE